MHKYSLLQELCSIHAPSSDEHNITQFIIDYVSKNSYLWKQTPKVYYGKKFQDAVILIFGNPKLAIYAHLDSVGYMVGYEKELLPIGSPKAEEGTKLVGTDSLGSICCTLHYDEESDTNSYVFSRDIERGTTLTFMPNFSEDEQYITSPFIDNRAGVWCALKLAETETDFAIAFSTYEEHHGGTVAFINRFLYKNHNIYKALIADITWVTKGIFAGNGCVISLRDSFIPRKRFVQKIIEIARNNKISIQCEVERSGGSDGSEIQKSSYPVEWCFIGAPQSFSHTPREVIHKDDLDAMLTLYKVLIKEL